MRSSSRSPRSGSRGYAHLAEIDVPVGRIWRALTDADLIRIWAGQEAEIDARKGGFYRLGRPQTGGREAHIDVFEPNRRLRLIYLNGIDTPSGEGAVVDDFLLDVGKAPGQSTLRLLGSGVPDLPTWDKAYVKMRTNWARLLGRLKTTLEAPPMPKKPPPPKDPPLRGLDY